MWLKPTGHERKRASIQFGLPRRDGDSTVCLVVMLMLQGAMSEIGAQQRQFPVFAVTVVSDLPRGRRRWGWQ